MFGDPPGRIADDPRHSEDKPQYVLVGVSEGQRLLAAIFTKAGGTPSG